MLGPHQQHDLGFEDYFRGVPFDVEADEDWKDGWISACDCERTAQEFPYGDHDD